MNKNMLIAVIVFVLLGGTLAAYFYWQNMQTNNALPTTAPPPFLPAIPKPEIRQIIDDSPVKSPLPKLADSDSFMLDALADLIGNKSLMRLFNTDRIIHNIVATIDNLPLMKLPLNVMPIKLASDKFIASKSSGALFVSPKNAARYSPYMDVANAIDAKKLVELYVRLYPLFQQSYEELGYPQQYFNDRLIVVIDDLLDAPDIAEPIKLVQPKIFYQFADPDLEDLSIGQRILIRTGNKNEATIKAKLVEIKQELNLHVHDKKIGITGG